MKSDFLKELNPAQFKAATEFEGPSLIIAGAGSGKTRVLTYRIAYMLAKGVSPHGVMALTFTNKAANEMKERISHLVGNTSARRIWMGTFHSIFYRILRMNAQLIGFSENFTIYDTDDSKSLLKKVIKDMNLDDKQYKTGEIHSRISKAKNNLITPSVYQNNNVIMQQDRMQQKPEVGKIFELYCQRCKAADAMDFDDLLLFTNILLRDFPEVLAKYQDHFQYLLVDEYQDTNYAQYLILKKLAAKHKNLCVVGDDAQSIYSFRGAKIENILNFEKDYPNYKLFKLEQNYRSTQNIVNGANNLIAKNSGQIPKKIFSENEEGEKITVLSSVSEIEESFVVADKILELKKDWEGKFTDFAILYRTNAQSRVFEDAFRKKAIPYRIYGGLSFYHRKEIKDLLAYFRLAVNNNDNEALKRIINIPGRGIGKTTIDRLENLGYENNVSIYQVIGSPAVLKENFNSSIVLKLMGFASMVQSFTSLVSTMDASELSKHILDKTALLKEYEGEGKIEYETRRQNIEELINSVHEFCLDTVEETGSELVTLPDYLQNVSLLTDADKGEKEEVERVSLMTVHAAKGLEFEATFIVGAEKDFFPMSISSTSPSDVEEERRLFYVALTRAKKQAFISYCDVRMRWGKTNPCTPSDFIKDIGKEFLILPVEKIKAFDKPATFGFTPKKTEGLFPRKTENVKTAQPEKPNLFATPQHFKPISAASSKAAAGNEIPDLKVGMKVEHDRFGFGVVLTVEGISPDIKAQIEFEHSGIKNLLLKFARIKIINAN